MSDEQALELAINAGANDCSSINNEYHEIITEKEDFYKVKSEIEKKVDNFTYSGVEWRPHNNINLTTDQNEKIIQILEALEEDDAVQNTFINCNIGMN